METIEMCELVKQGEGEELETQLIKTTTANGQPQLIQVVTTTNSAGHLIATPVSQIQEWEEGFTLDQNILVNSSSFKTNYKFI